MLGEQRKGVILLAILCMLSVLSLDSAFASSGNWVEVTRFTEDSEFLQTAFTIEHVEWRIRWEYEPDHKISEEAPALYVYVWDKEFPDTYFETILKKGTNETSGTLYIHNRNGTFSLGVIRTVTSFTLVLEIGLEETKFISLDARAM